MIKDAIFHVSCKQYSAGSLFRAKGRPEASTLSEWEWAISSQAVPTSSLLHYPPEVGRKGFFLNYESRNDEIYEAETHGQYYIVPRRTL